MSPQELKAHPKNWRKHPRAQAEGLDGVLNEVGWVQNVILNQRTGRLLDGHLRIELALKNHENEVPVTVVDLSEEEEEKVLVTLDPLSAMAKINHSQLEAIIMGIKTTNPAVADLIERIKKNSCIAHFDREGNPRDASQTDIMVGDVFTLGNHRIMCGDSTDKSHVEILMDGRAIDLLVTDPPYGIDYGSVEEMRELFSKGSRHREGIMKGIKGDKSEKDAKVIWDYAFSNAERHMKEGAVAYVFSPQGINFYSLSESVMRSGINIHQQIVWKKNRFIFGRSDYKYSHEVIIYGWKAGVHTWNGPGNETSVWECDAPVKSELHPTQKPLPLYERAILNSSNVGECVADLFGGSGTCIEAAERKGRHAYIMEIDPVFCQSIVDRWEAITNMKAVQV
jgi:DNA modification methylase